VTFRCYVCKRDREDLVYEDVMPCCGTPVRICGEKCSPLIARVCNGMTAERYVVKYRKVHLITCPKRLEM